MVTQRFSVPFSLSPFLSPNPSSPTATEPFIQQATGNTPHPSSSPPISSPVAKQPSSSPPISSPIGLTPTVRSQYPYYPSLSPGEDARPRNTDQPRQQSLNRAIPRLDCNLPEVKQWVNQCYHCGQLGHLMHACPRKHLPRIAEHEYDWRYVKYDNFTPATKLYSVMALWPKSQPLAPRTVTTEASQSTSILSTASQASSLTLLADEEMDTDGPPVIPFSTHPTYIHTGTTSF